MLIKKKTKKHLVIINLYIKVKLEFPLAKFELDRPSREVLLSETPSIFTDGIMALIALK